MLFEAATYYWTRNESPFPLLPRPRSISERRRVPDISKVHQDNVLNRQRFHLLTSRTATLHQDSAGSAGKDRAGREKGGEEKTIKKGEVAEGSEKAKGKERKGVGQLSGVLICRIGVEWDAGGARVVRPLSVVRRLLLLSVA